MKCPGGPYENVLETKTTNTEAGRSPRPLDSDLTDKSSSFWAPGTQTRSSWRMKPRPKPTAGLQLMISAASAGSSDLLRFPANVCRANTGKLQKGVQKLQKAQKLWSGEMGRAYFHANVLLSSIPGLQNLIQSRCFIRRWNQSELPLSSYILSRSSSGPAGGAGERSRTHGSSPKGSLKPRRW